MTVSPLRARSGTGTDADTDIIARVARAFSRGDASRLAAFDPDVPFEAVGIDSLDLAEIAAELEIEFAVSIDDVEFRQFSSGRAVADSLAARLDAGQH